MNRMTPAVTVLIAINVVMFGLNSLTTVELNQWLALYYPSNPSYGIWQYVTSLFMHGGLMHILFNMLGLWMFGTALESIWGTRKFVFFYFAAGIGAGIIYTLVNYFQFTADFDQLRALGMGALEIQQILDTASYNPNISGLSGEMVTEFYRTYHTPVLGASGAIYGVLVAFAITYPNSKLMLLFLPFPIAAKYFVPVILMIDLFSGVTGFSIFGSGIAHFAHLGGALIGFLLMMLWRTKAR